MYKARSSSLSDIVPEQWCLQGYGIIGVHTVSASLWISCIGPCIISDRLWSLRPLQNHLILPWGFEVMTCIFGGWSARIVLHILGGHFFLHNWLCLIISLPWLFLICLYSCGLWWLLRHLPHHCFPRLMSLLPFLESWSFLSKQYWTHSFILAPPGT